MIQRIAWLSVLASCLLSFTIASAAVVDRTVAIVNNDTITLSEVNDAGAPIFQKIMTQAPPAERPAALAEARKTIIDKLIDKKLILQEAQKLHVQVSDQDVDKAVQEVMEQNKMTPDQLRHELAAMGMSEKQYRDQLREQILSSRLLNYEVRARVLIPEEKVREYYDKHSDFTTSTASSAPEEVRTGSSYSLQQIGCMWGSRSANGTVPTKKQATEKIKKVYQLAMEGKDFKALARQYSDMPTAKDGGDLGVLQVSEMASYIREAIAHLNAAHLTPILASEQGFLFFKATVVGGKAAAESSTPTVVSTSGDKPPYDTVKEKIRDKLYKQALETRFDTWLKSVRANSYIRIL